MPVPARESHLAATLARLVRARNGIVVVLAPTEAGVPDRLVIHNGRLHLVELKTETGRVSAIQEAWHARVAARGVRVTVLYGRAQIEEWVEAL